MLSWNEAVVDLIGLTMTGRILYGTGYCAYAFISLLLYFTNIAGFNEGLLTDYSF
jgi:hypothetical protein